MTFLILGLVLFLGTHAFTMLRSKRAKVIGEVGETRYKLGYMVLSLLGLVLVGYGFGVYRQEGMIQVWNPPVFTRHLALVLNLLAFIALASAYLPGHIRAKAKHPMLLAVKIWATAHLLANGDLGGMLLFGAFLAWAVIARISAKRRARNPAEAVAQHGGAVAAPAGWRNDAIAVAVGLVTWFVFAKYLHPLLIGVAAWPGMA
ncbi:NnrU family protein [Methylobacterium sp. Leaf399]|uniref:NnrU family protein n=1 Tax=unclassified Methylobacterium TaxID=2615210 RepID=UPI0006F3DC59|nr:MULTISPECIES: NnrU family protein [unclassified Methylobacterium]KQP61771.1 NnrU family protein [Methylobacterium sp. Leaf108]KQT20040.1 NnrU family protein [Methylobacterium sp. Leaf399]KQT78304.1 NnrU family protein [Methylobacterium sp. Leaf466]